MATIRFHREYKHKLDKDNTRTWPTGWAGEIADDRIAQAAVKAGAASWVGDAPDHAHEPDHQAPAVDKRGVGSKVV